MHNVFVFTCIQEQYIFTSELSYVRGIYLKDCMFNFLLVFWGSKCILREKRSDVSGIRQHSDLGLSREVLFPHFSPGEVADSSMACSVLEGSPPSKVSSLDS